MSKEPYERPIQYRKVKKFLWLPLTLKNVTKWLTTAYIKEKGMPQYTSSLNLFAIIYPNPVVFKGYVWEEYEFIEKHQVVNQDTGEVE